MGNKLTLGRLKYEVDNFEVVMAEDSFMVLSADIISEGSNAHGTVFDIEDIVRHIPKMANKPINAMLRWNDSDFADHAKTEAETKLQKGIGTIPESNRAEIVIKNGVKFLRVNIIIWKYLFPQVESILKRRKEISISMEIDPIEGTYLPDGKVKITEWKFEALTFLGMGIRPAIKDAVAKVIKYSDNTEYFESVMLKYSAFIDSYSIPESIMNNITMELGKQQSNPVAITKAIDVTNKKKLSYSEINSLVEDIKKFSGDSKSLLGGDEFLTWASLIEKERNGGTQELKIKQLMTQKFSDKLAYFSHNETNVFCFDYETAQFKSFKYSYTEDPENAENVDFNVEEEFEVVVKLEGSDEFKATEALVEEDKVEDVVMYSIGTYSSITSELKEVKDALEEQKNLVVELNEKETAYSKNIEDLKSEKVAVETQYSEIQERILTYASLEKELVELREYKDSKEKTEKATLVNSLYSEYSEYLTEQETEGLNVLAETMDFPSLKKEVYSIVTPKIVTKLSTISQIDNLPKADESGLKFSFSPAEAPEDTNKPKTLTERIKSISS